MGELGQFSWLEYLGHTGFDLYEKHSSSVFRSQRPNEYVSKFHHEWLAFRDSKCRILGLLDLVVTNCVDLQANETSSVSLIDLLVHEVFYCMPVHPGLNPRPVSDNTKLVPALSRIIGIPLIHLLLR